MSVPRFHTGFRKKKIPGIGDLAVFRTVLHEFDFRSGEGLHERRVVGEGSAMFFRFAAGFKEQGEVLLLRFANDLEDYGKVEQMPLLEGKRMIIVLTPKKK